MDKKDDGRFVFGADSRDEPAAMGGNTHSRLDSLSLKVTLIAIIMPCLIGIVMVFGYLDMNRRVSTFKDTGSKEVRNASRDMERMVSSLQVQNARMEKLLADELGMIKKRLDALESETGRARKEVELLTATRITKKQMDASLAPLQTGLDKHDKALAQTQADGAATADRTKALEKAAAENLTRIRGEIAAVDKKVAPLSQAISALGENGARLKKEIVLMDKRIDVVRDATGSRLDKLEKNARTPAAPAHAPTPAPTGRITEQEIGN